jgi:hypothetical protein
MCVFPAPLLYQRVLLKVRFLNQISSQDCKVELVYVPKGTFLSKSWGLFSRSFLAPVIIHGFPEIQQNSVLVRVLEGQASLSPETFVFLQFLSYSLPSAHS